MKTPPVVVNLRHSQYDVYIGRAGKGQDGYFGNPFNIGKDGDRAEVIRKYEAYARTRCQSDPTFKQKVKGLTGRLGCFCSPQACHGDVLVKLWKELNGDES